MSRPLTPQQRQKLDSFADEVYTDFLNEVSQRRNISLAKVREVAKGRVWSGADAQQHNLVDEIGGLDAAFLHSVQHAKVKKEVVISEVKDSGSWAMRTLEQYVSRRAQPRRDDPSYYWSMMMAGGAGVDVVGAQLLGGLISPAGLSLSSSSSSVGLAASLGVSLMGCAFANNSNTSAMEHAAELLSSVKALEGVALLDVSSLELP